MVGIQTLDHLSVSLCLFEIPRTYMAMNIILPQSRQQQPSLLLEGYNSMVLLGANGSGKSRFGLEMVRLNENATMLTLLEAFPQFESLLQKLMKEEVNAALRFKEESRSGDTHGAAETRLDQIRQIWSRLLPYSRLLLRDGHLEMVTHQAEGTSYSAMRMSEGEKIIFFLLGSVLMARPNAMIVVDEPELHMGRALLFLVWDEIERSRPDCTFVYLTHDIAFASSRSNSRKIWIKSVNPEQAIWDYSVIESVDTLPEEIYFETLGSRRPLLFIEGTDKSSIDSKLYPLIFPEYTVKPLGSCTKVIDTTKAFAEQRRFHLLDSYGIVDRDRRTELEVQFLRRNNIFVPSVAEVENLLMLEPVIKAVARRMLQPEELVFAEIKRNVIRLFQEEIEPQALLHTRHQARRKLELMIDRKVETIADFAEHIRTLTDEFDTFAIWSEVCSQFRGYVADADYLSILKVYNQKGLLPRSKLFQLCGLSSKERYLNFVLLLLKERKSEADQIRQAIKGSLGVS